MSFWTGGTLGGVRALPGLGGLGGRHSKSGDALFCVAWIGPAWWLDSSQGPGLV